VQRANTDESETLGPEELANCMSRVREWWGQQGDEQSEQGGGWWW